MDNQTQIQGTASVSQSDSSKLLAANLPIGMKNYTTTNGKICEHKNGWYVTFRILFFHRRAMVCSDCGEVLYNRR